MKQQRNNILIVTTLLLLIISCGKKKNTPQAYSKISGKKIEYISVPAATAVSENDAKRIRNDAQHFYNTVLIPAGFNGGMLVAKNGTVLFEQYTGKTAVTTGAPITDSTSLHIASVSKTFTAMAILKLYEQKKISLGDELTKYFKNWNYPGITIASLLSHRSGLPNYVYFMQKLGWPDSIVIHNADVLNTLITKKDALKETTGLPNKSFSYNNTNYVLLALIIEQVTGMNYPAYMQSTIFEPLQMKHTFVRTDTNKNLIKSYDWKNREIPDNNLDFTYGDKNVYSTVRDLLKWDRALSTYSFLSERSLDSLAYYGYSNEKAGMRNYGYGWRMTTFNTGKKIIFHTGWWHGFNADFVRLLPEGGVIIAMGNKYTKAVYQVNQVANAFAYYFDIKEIAPIDTSKKNNQQNQLKPALNESSE